MLACADERGMLLRRRDVDVDDCRQEQVRRPTPRRGEAADGPATARVLGDPAALGRCCATCWITLCGMPARQCTSR